MHTNPLLTPVALRKLNLPRSVPHAVSPPRCLYPPRPPFPAAALVLSEESVACPVASARPRSFPAASVACNPTASPRRVRRSPPPHPLVLSKKSVAYPGRIRRFPQHPGRIRRLSPPTPPALGPALPPWRPLINPTVRRRCAGCRGSCRRRRARQIAGTADRPCGTPAAR